MKPDQEDQDLAAYHEWLNGMFGGIEICGKVFQASEILILMDEKRYQSNLNQFIRDSREWYDPRN